MNFSSTWKAYQLIKKFKKSQKFPHIKDIFFMVAKNGLTTP